MTPVGATNYTAAYDVASDVLQSDTSSNRKIMIFLSDGMPTLAYKDGEMHRGFEDSSNVFGSGTDSARLSLFWAMQLFATRTYYGVTNTSSGGYNREGWYQTYIIGEDSTMLGDDGSAYPRELSWTSFNSTFHSSNDTDRRDVDFPVMYDLATMDIEIPGMEYPVGDYMDADGNVEADAATFKNWYTTEWNTWTDAQKFAWVQANTIYPGDAYDLFYATESAFLDFRTENPTIPVYTLSYASGFPDLPSERAADEVLQYMVNEDESRYFPCDSNEELTEAIRGICGLSKVKITDPLSDYVDLADNPDLVITLKQGPDNAHLTETALYKNGQPTTAGQTYLDMDKTGFDANGTLHVEFKEDVILSGIVNVEAAFNVKVNEDAYDEYSANGYNATGDINNDGTTDAKKYITDYDLDHITSSGEEGFYSNNGAKASWRNIIEDNGDFPKPVVQVQPNGVEVKLKKIDATSNMPVSGAVFALYGSTNGVKNASPISGYEALTSDGKGIFSPADLTLEPGTYYLSEVTPKNGYVALSGDICITVTDASTNAVTVSGTSGNPAVTCADSVYTITVENTRKVPEDPVEPEDPGYADITSPVVDLQKQIEYLGDNPDESGNLVAGMEDLYRLYLNYDTELEPLDILLVIDQSGSMETDMNGNEPYNLGRANPAYDAGNTRQTTLKDFLNGTKADHSDGFINAFLSANENNDLAILTFSSDCTGDNLVRDWGTARTMNYVPLGGNDDVSGATNYTAALKTANDVLADNTSGHKKIMIFLSDGMPTYAYIDGHLQNGLNAEKVVGTGDNRSRSYAAFVAQYFSGAKAEFDDSSASSLYSSREDAWADVFTMGNNVAAAYDTNYADASWPVMYDLRTAGFDTPYLDCPPGNFYDEDGNIEPDGTTFLNWYNSSFKPLSSDPKNYNQMVNEMVIYPGDKYDLFYLTEQSFNEFREANENVPVYTIGFSDFGDIPSGRDTTEVLKFMAGDTCSTPSGRFYHCYQKSDLEEAINAICGISNIKITDPLSDYVDLAESPQLVIKLKTGPDTSHLTETTLYENGSPTTAGTQYLDMTKTGFDDDGTLHVEFKDGVLLAGIIHVESSFNVEVNDDAYDEYSTNGYNAVGDINRKDGATDAEKYITDHDLTHITSSGMDGFLSNDEATASWTYINEEDGVYPDPVAQVHPVDIQIKKIDAFDSTDTVLAGAEFDLYEEVTAGTTGATTYVDASGTTHYLTKINTSKIVSGSDGLAAINDLRVGKEYYLFETKAPNGYMVSEAPVAFRLLPSLDSTGAMVYSIETSAPQAVVDDGAPLLMEIKNEKMYELPSAGSIGLYPLCVAGAMLFTLAILSLARRRKEMQEA